MFESLGNLSDDPHLAYYLLRQSANASRMSYLSRTTPATFCNDALEQFDLQMRHMFVQFTGLPLNDSQWEQATFTGKQGAARLLEKARVTVALCAATGSPMHPQRIF